MHVVVDGNGVPLAAKVTPGQAHESKHLEGVLEAVRLKRSGGRTLRRPRRLAGDKGYSYPRIRRYLRRRGIRAIIPRRKDQRASSRPFDKESYRRRNMIERCVGWLKESRRLATRYEKLAVNFLAMIKLAMIRRCLRLLDSPDRT